ncbi:MAG: helix-turn-helix transcriptional regulator [Bacillota bacterium]|nr:helix-turn-helix transcriptional regulator [Bacillota bacterium]
MNVGKRIRELRKIKEITATELAEKSFISQSYLSDIERERTKPSLDTLFSICHALNITVADFFGKSFELEIDEQLRLIEYKSTDTRIMFELIHKLPENEKRAMISYLNERLKNMNNNIK